MQVQKLASNAIDKFERKANGKGAVSAGNRFTFLFQMKIWMILLKP